MSVPDQELDSALNGVGPDVEVVVWDMESRAPLDHLDIVVPPYLRGPSVLQQLSGLTTRLVQSQSIGYDGITQFLPPGHVFANAAGVHETSTAELAVALILASQRAIPDFVRDAELGRWSPVWRPGLADQTVLLVGYGGVGRALEARLAPFETTVLRVARSARTDQHGPVHDMTSLPELLARADIVVVAVPLSATTAGLVDDAFLSSMKDGALLVNVARGPVADTDALVSHSATGRIRLALDVTDPEPLPTRHPLFAMKNVLISPHVGGMSSAMLPRMATLVREQVERMARGLEPLNVVLRS